MPRQPAASSLPPYANLLGVSAIAVVLAAFIRPLGARLVAFGLLAAFIAFVASRYRRVQRALEAALAGTRESERRISQIVERISDAFQIIDRDWRFVYVNDRYVEMSRKPREQLLGHNVWELFPEAVGGKSYVEMHRAMRDQTPVQFDDYYAPLDLWYELRVSPSPEGLTVIATDVSARKRADLERERLLASEHGARRRAEEANRIKDEFLTTLSHELRTPLTAVLGWARLLRSGEVPADSVARAMEAVERNASAQAQLVDDLLDLSGIVTGKMRLDVRDVGVRDVIDAAVDASRAALDARKLALTVSVDPQMPRLRADAGRLQQAIWSLLSNAIKFTPVEGRVDISAKASGSEAQIVVSDTGQGMSPEFLPYAFDRFRQADNSSTRTVGGLGVGLTIVRHVVEAHGGRVEAFSAGEGQGTTITITLPVRATAHTDVLPDTPLDAAREFAPSLEGVRVLVVDDDADALQLARVVLETAGATVTVASSVAEAVQAAERAAPDVIVADIAMPEQDGFALLHEMKTRFIGGAPVIAMTAYAGEPRKREALAAGFRDYVTKPFDPADLVAAVVGACARTSASAFPR